MASLEDALVSSDNDDSSKNDEDWIQIHQREYDNFRSCIDLKGLDDEMTASTLNGLKIHINKNLKDWKRKQLVVGVTGTSGAGKSSLINALLGIKSKHKGAAPVGIKETTASPQTYNYPENHKIVLKDFPGVGTQTFPKGNYLAQTQLLDCSVVIVVTSSRFTKLDIWLAKQVTDIRRNVLFVRTKIDEDLSNCKAEDDDFSEYTCMEIIREDFKHFLEQAHVDAHKFRDCIYLVSSRHTTEYDFVTLKEKLKCLLRMKEKAICHLLYEHMKENINAKGTANATDFTGRKVASVVTGFLPIPKLESLVDTYHVDKIYEECLKRYCLDEESLKEIASGLDMSVIGFKNRLKSYSKEIADGSKLHSDTEDRIWKFVQKYSKYTFPVFGMIFSAYKSPCTMQRCLETICKAMAEDELMLVRLMLEKLERDLKEC